MQLMTLRFYVASLTEHAGGSYVVVLQPDYASGANAEWSQFTPAGRIELTLTKDVAIDFYRDAMRQKDTIHIEMSTLAKVE